MAFWRKKVSRNRERRETVRADLKDRGLQVIEIWEREANDLNTVLEKIKERTGA